MEQKLYLVNEDTNEKVVINGCKPSDDTPTIPSFRDYMIYNQNQLPNAVDLREYMTPVENQGNTASCVANALAGAYEYLLKRHNLQNIDVSRLFIYYNARARTCPSGFIEDKGCHIHKGIESLKIEGTCLEREWPFVEHVVNQQPNQNLYEVAKTNTVVEPVRLKVDVNEMRSCLAQGYPFIFSLKLSKSMALTRTNGGFLSIPESGEPTLGALNLHAMLAVGYSDQKRLFIVRNSWGPQWGDQGYIYVPYDYMGDQQYCSEVFTIRKLNNMDLGREHWITDVSQIKIGEPKPFDGDAEKEMNKWTVKSESELETKHAAKPPSDDEEAD